LGSTCCSISKLWSGSVAHHVQTEPEPANLVEDPVGQLTSTRVLNDEAGEVCPPAMRSGLVDALEFESVHCPLDLKARHLEHDGAFRREQNWIGSRLLNPSDARYVPPPEDRVEPLVLDLVEFLNRDDLPAVAHAAIAHAQFQTIHPFIDGNGRVGRCLIHVVLRRRGIATAFIPPISISARREGDSLRRRAGRFPRGTDRHLVRLLRRGVRSRRRALGRSRGASRPARNRMV
jgi:hypothetical protein